ncbi:PHD finger ALFIN-LIKE 2-like [Micractinium conductrix]|uniref:PHD finger ALFIN-LIKE 2-like n=1 Tax=Micractinium conductrix TaxID=554055 RepID=A0A2P6VCW0_9CHLO|nr:PHD finger ALFIN-LIKE 2-like [Micractinium conductrix]|eukprot:PSC71925.1 PHD finger ALFIN-LIKE 2-like [Micractinium conductrix]
MALRTVDDVFSDFLGRRRGIIKALTVDVDAFSELCDPSKDNLCLYGYADGTWEVSPPCEEVPPELPEPTLGINFARDGMKRQDWLCLVAVHADCWLMAMSFYNAAKIDQKGRQRLFEEINGLPTCFEIVSGRASGKPGVDPMQAAAKRAEEEEGSDSQDGQGDPCPMCNATYRSGEFWIQCDECDRWFDGKCVGMTAKLAEEQPQWKCPLCP